MPLKAASCAHRDKPDQIPELYPSLFTEIRVLIVSGCAEEWGCLFEGPCEVMEEGLQSQLLFYLTE